MANYYKDEAGHFTNKENDGGPCRHKRINNGKYEYSEDEGKSWKAFGSRDEYDKYEGKSWDFDENNDDDFGFDDEFDSPEYRVERIAEDIGEYVDSRDLDRIKRYCDKYEEDYGEVINHIAQGIEAGQDASEAVNEVLDDIVSGRSGTVNGYTREEIIEAQRKIEDSFNMPKEEGWEPSDFGEKSFIKNKDKDNEMFIQYNGSNYGGEDQDWVAGYMKNGEYINKHFNNMEDAKDFIDNADFVKDVSEESSPMNEFSGPEGSELSYAQLESLYGKDFENKSKKFNKEDWHYNPESDTYSREPQPRKGLVKDTLVDKFDDAHLYNDGGKFQLALGDGSTKEFDSKDEAIDYLSEYSKRDYSWAKDKSDDKEWRLKPENLAVVQKLQKMGLDTGSMSEEDFEVAKDFVNRFKLDLQNFSEKNRKPSFNFRIHTPNITSDGMHGEKENEWSSRNIDIDADSIEEALDILEKKYPHVEISDMTEPNGKKTDFRYVNSDRFPVNVIRNRLKQGK